MHTIVGYLLPLLAALTYTLATLFVKRALSFGAGMIRFVFIANLITVPFFVPVLWMNSAVLDWSVWWAVLLCGFFNFAGMILTFVSIRVGDVSVQTPLMGVKVIMVGALSVILGAGPVPLAWWIGAVLSVLAVYILSKPSKYPQKHSGNMWLTVVFAMLTALSFAICDVMMSKYAPIFGEGPLLFGVTVLTGVFSLGLIPFFEGRLKDIPKVSWVSVGWGSLMMAIEVLLICLALGFYGNATAVNILYSSRGIWSVVLVWLLGGWFGNSEREQGKEVMIRRLVGAFLLFLAIILVITTE